MTTLFPDSIDSFTTKVDGVDDVMAEDINDPQDAIVAIETLISQQGGRNFLYDSLTHDIWPLGTTFNDHADGAQITGHWYGLHDGNAPDVTGEAGGSTDTFSRSLKVTSDTAGATRAGYLHWLSAEDSIPLRGKTVSLSCKCEASLANNMRMMVVEWSGTADAQPTEIISVWNNTPTLVANTAFAETPSAIDASSGMEQRVVNDIEIADDVNNVGVFIWFTFSGSGQTAEFANFCLELGGGATEFRARARTVEQLLIIGGNLATAIVTNSSGAAVIAGDVGYIDESGEFQTTTTANFFQNMAVVVVGGADSASIVVTMRGRVTVNYTGGAPSAGDFLVTSTTAGNAQAQSTMRSEIFAVCLANGSGGSVDALLLTRTIFIPATSSNLIVDVRNTSDSEFVATINGAPTATSVVYNAPSAGSEDVIVPNSSSDLGKQVLHNTTRGTSRLIESVDTGTNTITTVSSADSWANGDTITIESQTVTTGAAPIMIDVDLGEASAVAAIPQLARAIFYNVSKIDSGGISEHVGIHPYESYGASKRFLHFNQVTATWLYSAGMVVDLIDRKFAWQFSASGSGTAMQIMRLYGYFLASP